MSLNISADAASGKAFPAKTKSSDSFRVTGIDLLRDAESDKQFLNILEANFGIHLPARKPERLSGLEPHGAFHIYAEPILENGYPVVPVSPFSKLPCQPKVFGAGSLLTRRAIIEDLEWCIREDRAFSDVIVDGMWLGGPRTMALSGWPKLTVEQLQADGTRHADFRRWLARCATEGGRYLGLGVVTSSTFVAIDVDVDDPDKLESVRALMDKLGGVQVERIGCKGFARFFQMAGGERAATKLFGGIDILAGAFCVIPPSYHSGLNGDYRWTSERTLVNTHRDELPRITLAQIAEIVEVVVPGAVEADRVKTARAAEYEDREQGFHDELHHAALLDPSWVFDLTGVYGPVWKRDGGVQGVNMMRPSGSGKPPGQRKRNLHVDASGITDFGKTGDRGFSAVGLVMESEHLSRDDALEWLAGRLGIETPYRRALRGIADMPAHALKLGGWWLVIPSGKDIAAGAAAWLEKDYPGATRADFVDSVDDVESADIVESFVEGDNDAVLAAANEAREMVVGLCRDVAQLDVQAKRDRLREEREKALRTARRIIESAEQRHAPEVELIDEASEALTEAHRALERVYDDQECSHDRFQSAHHELVSAETHLQEMLDRLEREETQDRVDVNDSRRVARGLTEDLKDIDTRIVDLQVYTGLGKTTAFLEHGVFELLAVEKRALYTAPSLDLAREAKATFEDAAADRGVEAKTALVLGMDARDESGKKICEMSSAVAKLRSLGGAVTEFCGPADINAEGCPYRSTCPIFKARQDAAEADVCFAASANLFVDQPGLSDFRPHVVFVDESFTSFGRGDPVEISTSDLRTIVGDIGDEERTAIEQAFKILFEQPGHDDARSMPDDSGRTVRQFSLPDAAEDQNAYVRVAGGLKVLLEAASFYVKSNKLRVVASKDCEDADQAALALESDSDGDLGDRLRIANAQCMFASSLLNDLDKRFATGVRLVNGDTVRILPSSRVRPKYLGGGDGAVEAVILANATPEPETAINASLSRFVAGKVQAPEIETIGVQRPPMAATVSGEVISGFPATSAKLGFAARRDKISSSGRKVNVGAKNRAAVLGYIRSLIDQHAGGDPSKAVFIGPEKIRSWLESEIPDLARLERGKTAGTNRFEAHRLLIYWDRQKPPYVAAEELSRVAGVWVGPEDYEKHEGSWRLKDDGLRAIETAMRAEGIIQGVERIRTRWCKDEKQHIVVITDLDDVFPAGEFSTVRWTEIKSAQTAMLKAHDIARVFNNLAKVGVVSKHAELMERVHEGETFNWHGLNDLMSAAPVLDGGLVQDENESGPIGESNIGPISFSYFRQTPGSKRKWSVAFSYRKDVKALISNAFGGAVEFKEDADQTQIELVTHCELVTSELVTPVFTTPANLMAADPDRFSTISAAKMHLQRHPPARPDGWVEVVVTLEGRGQRPGAVYVPAGLGRVEVINAVEQSTGRKLKAITAVG